LLKLGFDSLEAFSLFPTEDVDKELRSVSLGQRLLIKKLLSNLDTEEKVEDEDEEDEEVQLNLGLFHQPPPIMQAEGKGNLKQSSKYKDITQYISLSLGSPAKADSIEVVDGRILLTPKKQSLEKLSVAQYMEAALKIHAEVAAENTAEGEKYLQYLLRIAQMAQVFTWSSVLLFDREFRKECAAGQQWDREAPYLMSLLLRAERAEQAGFKGRRPQKMDATGRPVCIRWNRGACTQKVCRYAHVCLACNQIMLSLHTPHRERQKTCRPVYTAAARPCRCLSS
jgi:hypothetical protein